VRAPPENGRGRVPHGRPGLDTQQIPPPSRTANALSVAVGRGADVIDLADARSRRVERIEAAAGPWWGDRLLRSASWAEASRSRRWSA
jgi:hypothetical protein